VQGKDAWAVGEKHLHATVNPPRIVLVPVGGRIEKPFMRDDATLVIAGRNYRARHIHDDVQQVQAHIWAADAEKLDRLKSRLLSAVRQCFGRASEPGAYSITTETTRSGHTVYGAAAVQQFTWRMKVCEFTGQQRTEAGPMVPVRRLVTILGQTHDCSIDTTL
jgi:hypothetical protein